jgi:antitoxin (DNA-binding transcriptional repressor) of toxin-antitoxin stability system
MSTEPDTSNGWKVAAARANFATLLEQARTGETQRIYQAGLPDVLIVAAPPHTTTGAAIAVDADVAHDLHDLAAARGLPEHELARRAVELLKRDAFWDQIAQIEPEADYWEQYDAWKHAHP